jgi:hypothetical protein
VEDAQRKGRRNPAALFTHDPSPVIRADSREVTIISGVFATGYGEKFDSEKLKVLPAGSFYTEPANLPHFIEIREETVLQVSGTGPSGRLYLDRPDDSK